MTSLDYFVLAVIGLSVLLAAMRGFAREVLAWLSWIGAFWVAKNFALDVAALLPGSIPGEPLRLLIGFVALFVAALIIFGLLARLVSALIKGAGLGGLDRALGILFGFARGLLIVLVATLLAGLTSAPQTESWRNAKLRGPVETGAIMVKAWLPDGFARHIHFARVQG